MAVLPRFTAYEPLRKIGEGTFSSVYLAESLLTGELCALKVFHGHSDVGSGPTSPEPDPDHFTTELKALARLRHPNLVRLLDFGRTLDTDERFLALEYLDGQDFVSASKKASRAQFYDMLAQVCRILDYLHRRGLCHGDLKPRNLIVYANSGSPLGMPTVKLLDLGASNSPDAPSATQAGGSPHYLAPEILQGHRPTIRSDLYSFGAILYECLAGAPPFEGRDLGEILQSHLQKTPGPIEGEALKELHPLTYQLLRKDPGRRPPSPSEALRRLSAVAAGGPCRPQTAETFHALARPSHVAGRADLLAAVGRILREARDGVRQTHPVVLLIIEGEPGAGTTRVLDEIALEAFLSGFRVQRLVRRPGPEAVQRVQRVVSSFLDDGATPTPVIVFDDPGALDALGLEIIRTIATEERRPCVLALGLRTSDHRRDSIEELLRSFSKDIRLLRFSLSPLSEEQISGSVKLALGIKGLDPRVARHLAQQSGGNARVTTELLASLLDREVLEIHGESLNVRTDLASAPPPPSVAAWLTGCWRSLSSPEVFVAWFLAASDDRLSDDDLTQLTGIDRDRVRSCCDSLARKGVARVHTHSPAPTFAIAGGLWRGKILTGFSQEEARDVHATLARWYVSGANSRVSIERAATNFVAAGLPEEAITYCIRAANEFLRASEHERAIEYYQSALDQKPSDPVVAAEITLGLSTSHSKTGRLAVARALLERFTDSESLPPALAARMQLRLAVCLWEIGDHLGEEMAARRALRLARIARLVPETIEALAALGSSLSWLEQREKGEKLSFRAATMARRAGLRQLSARSLLDVTSSFWKSGHYQKALHYERRRYCLVRGQGDTGVEITSLMNIGILLSDQGVYTKARRHHRQALDIALKRAVGTIATASLVNLGETHICQGRWRRALKCNRSALSRLRDLGVVQQTIVAESNIALILTRTANYDQAQKLLEHKLGKPRALGGARISTALLLSWGGFLLEVGHYELARRVLTHVGRLAETKQLWHNMLEQEWMMALALCGSGRLEEARERLADAIVRLQTRSPFDIRISARLALVQIDVRRGATLDAIEAALTPLLATARKKKMHWHLAWALMMRAEAMLGASRGGEVEQSLFEALRLARRNADRNATWRIHRLLGRVQEQLLRYERALTSYRAATLTLREISMDIEDGRFRSSFLDQVDVRDTIERHRRLRGEVGKRARYDLAAVNRNEMISRKMLASLSSIGRQLTSILDLDRLLSSVLDLAIENVRAERGIVFLRDPTTGELRPECARGLNHDSIDQVSSFSRSVVLQAARGQTLLTVDVGKDPALGGQESIILHGIKSILCVPMRARGSVSGVIYLDTRRATQLFTDKERAFVESFAGQAAVAIENARLFGDIRAENARLRREVQSRFQGLVGSSPAMQRLNGMVAGVLRSECNVIIRGESGTGKELVARAIHYNGPRQDRGFVAVDCGALPENLREAELFGCARGAYTGADRARTGLIEAAHGGTLFLDEITNTSVSLQARLLRVLQEREVRRLGETKPRQVDIRFIAATNANLEELIERGLFRQDLYYRLNVVTIDVPPLRERITDIPFLVDHFLRSRRKEGGTARRLGPGVMEALCRYDWPGNVRELQNVIERLIVLATAEVVTINDLPGSLRLATRETPGGSRSTGDRQKTGEQLMIEAALCRMGGDKAKAARFIGWNRPKLYRRIKAFRIPADYGKAA